MPASITAKRPMMAVSVRWAWRTAGSRKAVTPLLTASTPVIAVQPLAKARIRTQRLAAVAAAGSVAGASTGTGWPFGQDRLDDADRQDRQQRDDKEIGRCHERQPRFANPAQVDDRDQHQNRQTERQRMGLQNRQRRDQCPDPRRNADGHDQHVVQQERRRGKQARGRAQVVLGDRVRPAPLRIRRDRLAIGEVDDDQEHDDQRADRPDVRHPGRAERYQERQRGLRPVSRRPQRIKAQHRNAGNHPDALLSLFIGRQPPAKQIINQ